MNDDPNVDIVEGKKCSKIVREIEAWREIGGEVMCVECGADFVIVVGKGRKKFETGSMEEKEDELLTIPMASHSNTFSALQISHIQMIFSWGNNEHYQLGSENTIKYKFKPSPAEFIINFLSKRNEEIKNKLCILL